NVLNQTALDLDRAENRITFNQEQVAQLDARAAVLSAEIEQAARQGSELNTRLDAQREAVAALRKQSIALEAGLRESTEQVSARGADQNQLESRMEELRQMAGQLVEEAAHRQAESLQAEEIAARHAAAEEQRATDIRETEHLCTALQSTAESADTGFQLRSSWPANFAKRSARRSHSWLDFARQSRRPAKDSSKFVRIYPQSARGTLPSSRFCASAPTLPMRCKSFSTRAKRASLAASAQ